MKKLSKLTNQCLAASKAQTGSQLSAEKRRIPKSRKWRKNSSRKGESKREEEGVRKEGGGGDSKQEGDRQEDMGRGRGVRNININFTNDTLLLKKQEI